MHKHAPACTRVPKHICTDMQAVAHTLHSNPWTQTHTHQYFSNSKFTRLPTVTNYSIDSQSICATCLSLWNSGRLQWWRQPILLMFLISPTLLSPEGMELENGKKDHTSLLESEHYGAWQAVCPMVKAIGSEAMRVDSNLTSV